MESLGLEFKVKTAGPSPELRANVISFFTWHWIQPLINKGNKRPIQSEDLYDLLPRETTEFCERLWESHSSKLENPSVWRLLFLTAPRELLYSLLCCPVWLAAVTSQVYVVRSVVQQAEHSHEKLEWWRGMLLVCGLLLTSAFQGLSLLWNFTFGQKAGMKIKAVISMAVFNKLLRLRMVALSGTSSGKMMNLISNDTQKFVDGCAYMAFSITSIFSSLLVCGLAMAEVGISALPGVGVIIFAQIAQMSIAQGMGRIRKRAVTWTDSRVRTVAEILSGVRVVKYNGWTTAFIKRIQDIRTMELRWIRKAAFLRASTSTIRDSIAPLASLVTLGTYSALHNRILSASKAFTILGLYGILVRIFSYTPTGLQIIRESYVGIQRLQTLMDVPNGTGDSSPEDVKKLRKLHPDAAVVIVDGTFSWCLEDRDLGSSYQSEGANVSKVHTEAGDDNPQKQKQNSQNLEVPNSFHEPDDNLQGGILKGINLSVAKGEMIGIIGPVGSGKSSLLFALLGEMECTNGAFWTERMVSYAPQQPWILNDTIRNNILCSSEYDEARYTQVVFACALDHDIQQLPAADGTEIGERGVNLSGGQKARISLARACYAPSPVLLLDDPLAAVDVPTARHLMEHVLGGILKGRTVILVTHNKSSLEFVNRVFLMKNGTLQEVQDGGREKLIEQDLVEELDAKEDKLDEILSDEEIDHSESFTNSIGVIQEEEKAGPPDGGNHVFVGDGEAPQVVEEESHVLSHIEVTEGQISDSMHHTLGKGSTGRIGSIQMLERKSLALDNNEAQKTTPQKTGALTLKEDRVVGEVTWKTYWNYLQGGGLIFFVFVAALMCFTQAERVMVDYWIAVWVADKYHKTQNFYLMGYVILVFGNVVLSLSRGLLFTAAAIRAAKHMHQHMSQRVLRSPQLFFDQNPVGRILNRFSKDQSMVDELLPYSSQSLLEYTVGGICVLVFSAVILPWFTIIMLPFSALIWYFRRKYVVVSREIKRVDGLTRSPTYAHFSQTMQGVASVRAFGIEAVMHDHFCELINANNRSYITSVHTNRWLGARLDFCAGICVSTTALITILLHERIPPGVIGVILIQGLQLTSFFQNAVRLSAEIENLFTSVERIQTYENLPTEADPDSPPGLISEHWPEKGEIEFIKYTMAYRVDLRPVLNDLSFKVLSEEKVGILGRTGAGKSSLAAALFRMVENTACSGSILVDGVDLKLVGLDDIRKRLSIIPQDPVLFRGTVRLNLDPFELHNDAELYEALAKVQLTQKIKSLKDGLSSLVQENGDNFSVGQRQLLCLARSLLRRSKIIVMDEATAAVDGETDHLIQQTMRSVFQYCTVLTIAHRIETIIDCHRVLVLAKRGRVSEFDTPANLLRRAEKENFSDLTTTRSEHVFANMVAQAGPALAQRLKEAAEEAEKKRSVGVEPQL